MWKDHPEKALGTTAEFVKKNPNTARAVVMAILEAGRWIDAGLQNKNKMAETIADKSYVNTSVDAINQRILGRYQNGLGKTWDDPNHMKFFNDGLVNFPYLSDGMWFLTQHKRCGLLKEHPDYLAVAKQINQFDLYRQAASALKVNVPKDVMRSSKLIDGVAVNGSASVVGLAAGLLRKLQSGYLYHYAFAMILGLVALLALANHYWP